MASGIINISKPADLFEGWFEEREGSVVKGPDYSSSSPDIERKS